MGPISPTPRNQRRRPLELIAAVVEATSRRDHNNFTKACENYVRPQGSPPKSLPGGGGECPEMRKTQHYCEDGLASLERPQLKELHWHAGPNQGSRRTAVVYCIRRPSYRFQFFAFLLLILCPLLGHPLLCPFEKS